MKYYRFAAVLLAAVLLFLGGTQAAAAADVVMGGHVVARLNNEEQANSISQKIEALLQSGASSSDIKVVRKEIASKAVSKDGKPVKKYIYGVYWGRELIIDVTEEIAKQNSSSSEALARLWAGNMRNIADIGLLNVDASRLVMARDTEKVLNVSGLSTATLQAEDRGGVVDAEVDEENSRITVKAKRVGKSTLVVTRGPVSINVFVHVKDWAGKLPKNIEVEVTGTPAQADAVAQAVMLSIASQTQVQPGCSAYVDDFNFKTIAVPAGDSMRFSLPAGITGSDEFFNVKGNVSVYVKNVNVPVVDQNILMVSNRPERVDRDGILMKYEFTRREPARLMFSHLNASERRRHLWINLTNLSDEPLKIAISRTSAGPERSEIYVGQTSAKRFLENMAVHSGCIITMAPNSALELAAYEMGKEALVSGFINFQILEGDSACVEVRTSLDPSANDGRDMEEIGAPFNPFKIHPHGVFAQPYFENEGDFVVGSEPLSFRYGESPWLIDFQTGLPNTGNFGVLYKSLVTLKNPTKRTKMVGLYFTPLSGPGGANFLIGDKVYQAVFRKKGEEALVAKIELAPESENTIEVITLPEATSCYPAQYQFRDL